MNCKCTNCGHIFDDCESHKVYDDPSGGDIAGGYQAVLVEDSCPMCGGAYEEAVKCADCGGLFLENELRAGLCEECFEDAINYSTFLAFADYEPVGGFTSILEDFIFEALFGITLMCAKPDMSRISRINCRELYLRKALAEKYKGGDKFLTEIRRFVHEHYLMDFADFLESQKEVRA